MQEPQTSTQQPQLGPSHDIDGGALDQFFQKHGPPPDDPRSNGVPKAYTYGTIGLLVVLVCIYLAVRCMNWALGISKY